MPIAYNADSIGICVIGNFMTILPNSAAQNAVKSLIQCGVELGRIKVSYQLKGHRDGSATACPGS
jgi:N-acetylmuramoyl-L-alanine amidase